MNVKILSALTLVIVFGLSVCEAGQQEGSAEQAAQVKPAVFTGTVATMEATVAAVDQNTREVTLQDAEGNSVTLTAGEEVKNLPQVEVGDQVNVEYLETVTVQVFSPDQVEMGAEVAAAAATAEPGQKPAGAAVAEVTIVAVIKAIDKEQEQVTLQGPEGDTKTVKVRNPANLEKVAVGDKVMITYTQAIAITVTEKSATE